MNAACGGLFLNRHGVADHEGGHGSAPAFEHAAKDPAQAAGFCGAARAAGLAAHEDAAKVVEDLAVAIAVENTAEAAKSATATGAGAGHAAAFPSQHADDDGREHGNELHGGAG